MSKTQYGAGQWRDIREEVLERDDYECRFCSKSDEQHRSDTGSGLDVHHIIPKADGGKDNKRNLAALCRSCHRTMENLHGQAMGELATAEDYGRDLKGLNRVYRTKVEMWDVLEELLDEWLQNHRVFRDELGFINEGGEEDSITNWQFKPHKIDEEGISSEWEFLMAYGYKEGIVDVTCDLDGWTDVPHEEFGDK